ncbi:hypothetical protein V6N12_043315 [Hibiscus sabdariffa]|uniref:Uncharacterized protein n=1 Tax=Hibiscus sabdariffa TaxID=183260 RepID=A0ABR2DGY5_9ROSI
MSLCHHVCVHSIQIHQFSCELLATCGGADGGADAKDSKPYRRQRHAQPRSTPPAHAPARSSVDTLTSMCSPDPLPVGLFLFSLLYY